MGPSKFGFKETLVQKIIDPKNVGSKNIWVLQSFGPKEIESTKILGPNRFSSLKSLSPKFD